MWYDILCHCGRFSNDISYEQVYKYNHGRVKFEIRVKSLPDIETKFGMLCISTLL